MSNNRKFTFNDFILLLPLIGRIIFEFQDVSKRTFKKRLFILFENTMLYYGIGVIGTVFYSDKVLYIGAIVFLGISLIEYYFIKKNPKLFGADDITNIKWYNIFFTFYHEFWFFLFGYICTRFLILV